MHRGHSVVVAAAVALLVSGAVAPASSHACGWDYETYHAEAESLPCVHDAALGFWPKHTEEYDRARIKAFETALAWAPHWTGALDAIGISQIRLGELELAQQTLTHRLRVAPDAYASHANLGTLYTFQGRWDLALEHINVAMGIEPDAHFGREDVHRRLVEYMKRVADDPTVGTSENFLGIAFDDGTRFQGSPERFEAAGWTPRLFDALVSMITVYGGERLPELYLALGEALSLRGDTRLAYTAYRRAQELGHPRGSELAQWQERALAHLRAEAVAKGTQPAGYVGIDKRYRKLRGEARAARRQYRHWEQREVRRGLRMWTDEGLDRVYAKMNQIRERCPVQPVAKGEAS